jgi:hypothetical protein
MSDIFEPSIRLDRACVEQVSLDYCIFLFNDYVIFLF